jgi:hypothetical protein
MVSARSATSTSSDPRSSQTSDTTETYKSPTASINTAVPSPPAAFTSVSSSTPDHCTGGVVGLMRCGATAFAVFGWDGDCGMARVSPWASECGIGFCKCDCGGAYPLQDLLYS